MEPVRGELHLAGHSKSSLGHILRWVCLVQAAQAQEHTHEWQVVRGHRAFWRALHTAAFRQRQRFPVHLHMMSVKLALLLTSCQEQGLSPMQKSLLIADALSISTMVCYGAIHNACIGPDRSCTSMIDLHHHCQCGVMLSMHSPHSLGVVQPSPARNARLEY